MNPENNNSSSSVPVVDSTPASASPRGSNYSVLEDKQLCMSWLAVSADPIVGREQHALDLWHRIKAHFDAALGESYVTDRTTNSLSCRWSTISKEVSKYCGFYANALRTQQSGTNMTDVVMFIIIFLKIYIHVIDYSLL